MDKLFHLQLSTMQTDCALLPSSGIIMTFNLKIMQVHMQVHGKRSRMLHIQGYLWGKMTWEDNQSVDPEMR